MKNISYIPMILCLFVILNPTLSLANHTSQVTMHITGNVYIPPCVINNGRSIDFNFGAMSRVKIDGKNYAKSLTFPVVCSYSQGTPYIKVAASSLYGAPQNVLATGINGFGILLYFGNGVDLNKPLNISTSTDLSYPITAGFTNQNKNASQLTITAVPYKKDNITLDAKPFSVTGTMTVIYK